MSSFYCEKCGASLIDMPGKGYITFCKHYPPPKKKKIPKNFEEIIDFINNDK